MSQYSHDEIVIAIDKVIIETVKQIVDELLQSSGLVERDLLLYSKISLLRQFIQSGQSESIRRVNRPPIKDECLQLFSSIRDKHKCYTGHIYQTLATYFHNLLCLLKV